MSSTRPSSPSIRAPTTTPALQEIGGEQPRLARANDDAPRPVVHQRPDLVEVARSGEPALRHHEHVRAEALHLVEHVARDDDAAALAAEPLEELDHVGALARVEPGQRLVEHDQPRVVDDRLRELDALAHALRVRRQAPLVRRIELDRLERGPGGGVGIGEAVQRRGQADEAERGERLEDGFLLRHEADAAA